MTRLAAHLSQSGCDGLFVASSTGEAIFLDEQDRRILTVAAREGVTEGTTIYVGVSALGIRQTVRYAKNAAADGADVAVVMAPFFLKVSQRELKAYLRTIADEVPIPVALYHHPRIPTPVEIETVVELAAHPNVVAIKDTSGTVERATTLLRATAGMKISVLQGSEGVLNESLAAGAHGAVAALACMAPEWFAGLYATHRKKDLEMANEFASRIRRLCGVFEFPEMGESIAAFAHAIKLGARKRGWLERVEGMLTGYKPATDFEKRVVNHFDGVGLPRLEGMNARRDSSHLGPGDHHAIA